MSCKFCEGLFDEEYKMIWNMRSSYADDNFCEKVLNNTCENCTECNVEYYLQGWKNEQTGHTSISCNYKFSNGDIVIWNFTEPLNINYCPYCGERLSENLIDFDDIGNWVADIESSQGETWDYEDYKIRKKFNIK